MKGIAKLLMAMFLCIATMAYGVEVISIDINEYGNDVAYSGEAAVAGATEWTVYYGGWAQPAGSPRSADLAEAGTTQGSVYAAQVWVGDAGGHDYVSGAEDGLLDDGFVSSNPTTTLESTDPNFTFVGPGLYDASGVCAYGGTYDVYIYSNSAGYFQLTDANSVEPLVYGEGAVTGTTSGFVEGENYLLFENITIADANSLYLWYSNELNGIQLVSLKDTPKVINPDSTDPNDYFIDVVDYDVAYDTNARESETTPYGPDYSDSIHYLDSGEYMGYDISIAAEYEGEYEVTAFVKTYYGDAELEIYLDDISSSLGTLSYAQTGDSTINETNAAKVNLFEGTHTLKWAVEGGNIYFDIVSLKLNYIGPINFETCEEVVVYGLQPAGDVNNDCVVDIDDLVDIVSEWLESNDPQ